MYHRNVSPKQKRHVFLVPVVLFIYQDCFDAGCRVCLKNKFSKCILLVLTSTSRPIFLQAKIVKAKTLAPKHCITCTMCMSTVPLMTCMVDKTIQAF